jgi:hypothetical protein
LDNLLYSPGSIQDHLPGKEVIMRRMIQILLVLSLLAVGLVAPGAALSLEEPPTPRPQVSPDSVGYRLTPAEQEHLVELGLDPQEVSMGRTFVVTGC